MTLISSSKAEEIFTLLKQSVASGCYFTSQAKPNVPAGTKSTKISYRPAPRVSGLRQLGLQGKSGNNPMTYTLLYFFQKGSTIAVFFQNGLGRSDLNVVRIAAAKLR
jgi:hypothetical protein